MSEKNWYVHLQGETIGPLPTPTIALMLRQNRLQFVDFVWTDGMSEWRRISELEAFRDLLPARPSAPVPAKKEKPAKVKEEAATEAPPPRAVSAAAKETFPKIRKFKRVDVSKVSASLRGLGEFPVVNVSEGGLFLAAANSPAMGTDVVVHLQLPGTDKKMELTGVVIRHGESLGQKGFAVEFTRLNPAHWRVLRGFISSHGERE